MTGNEMQNKIRRQLRHEQGRFDLLRIIDELNAGLWDFCAETLALVKVKSYEVRTFKRDYDLPSDFLDIRNIYYNLKPMIFKSQQEMKDIFSRQGSMATKGTPTYYYQPVHGKIAVHPIPDTDRTTGTIASAISATRTSFRMLTGGTSGFNDIGFLLVSDVGEVIQYFTLTTNEFSGIVRAEQETSGETIASAVTLNDLNLRMDYYALDLGFTATTMGNSPQLSKEYHNAIVDYAMWQLLNEVSNTELQELSKQYEQKYMRVRHEARGNIKKQQRSKLLTVRDTSFGGWL